MVGVNVEQISLEQIESAVKGRIEKCTEEIRKFMILVDSRLDEDDQYCGEMSFIQRQDGTAYEDDGNTQTPGYVYEAYWCFQLNPNTSFKTYGIFGEFIYQEECLFFKYTDAERVIDHKADGRLRSFELNFCGIKQPHETSALKRIDYNNNNYDLTSIITIQNAATCILEIQRLAERRKLVESLMLEETKL